MTCLAVFLRPFGGSGIFFTLLFHPALNIFRVLAGEVQCCKEIHTKEYGQEKPAHIVYLLNFAKGRCKILSIPDMPMKIFPAFCGFIFAAAFFSCKNEDSSPPIPYVPVNRTITLANPQFSALNAVGGFVILPEEGYGGVIVVRATGDQVFAFDMQCTLDALEAEGRTSPDPSLLFLRCGKCESKWQIINGQLTQGPAIFPLLQYQTTFDGFVIKIYN